MRRAALLLCLLLPALGEASHLVLFGSGKGPSDAEHARLELEAEPFAQVLELPRGYPKVEGGRLVVGACTVREDAERVAGFLRALGRALQLDASAEVRRAPSPLTGACPKVLPLEAREGADPWLRSREHAQGRLWALELFELAWSAPHLLPPGRYREDRPPKPLVVGLLTREGIPVDGRVLPLPGELLRCMRGDECPLLIVRDPPRPDRFGALLRDGPLSRTDGACRKHEPPPPDPEDPDAMPSDDPGYEAFQLSRLELRWQKGRIRTVEHRELGQRCCRVLGKACVGPVLEPEVDLFSAD